MPESKMRLYGYVGTFEKNTMKESNNASKEDNNVLVK